MSELERPGISLRELLELQIVALERATGERYTQQERALELLAKSLAAQVEMLRAHVEEVARLHSEAHAREHVMTQDALLKAEAALEKRLEGLNEFRAQLSDQAATFVRRDMMDERLKAVTERLDMLERAGANLQGRMWALGVGLTLMILAINILLRFLPAGR